MAIREIILVLAALIIIVLSFAAHKNKIFAKIQVIDVDFSDGSILYKIYQGDYSKISSFFDKTVSEINNEIKEDAKKVKFFGIYYDDPAKIKNPNESRAIVGIIYNQVNKPKVSFDAEDFARRHSEYKTAPMPELDAFGAFFPLLSKTSMMLHIARGYPAIKKYGAEKNLMSKTKFSLEIYSFTEKKFFICFPHGDGIENLANLSGIAKPEYKAETKPKTE